MTPEELKRLNDIEKKLDQFFDVYYRTHFIDKDIFSNRVIINNKLEIRDGVQMGNATTSLNGFYGATPVDQPATIADPAGGVTVDSQARTAINTIIDRLQELGLIA